MIQKCPHCPYITRFASNLTKHITRSHTEDNVTTCPYCAKATKNIKRHLQQNWCDKPEERLVFSVKCARCDKTFSRKEHRERHLKSVHEKILDVLCSLCDYKTHSNFNLRVHMTGSHKGRRGPYKGKAKKPTECDLPVSSLQLEGALATQLLSVWSRSHLLGAAKQKSPYWFLPF